MENQKTKIHIFICYCHKDNLWFQNEKFGLIPWLEECLKRYDVELWYDHDLTKVPFVEFKDKIRNEIENADLAVLLLSQDFLNSDFIRSYELPLVKNRTDIKGLAILPILVAPLDWEEEEELKWILDWQILPGKPTPLINYTKDLANWQQVRIEILSAIRKRVQKIRKLQIEKIKKEEDERKRENEKENKKEIRKRKPTRFINRVFRLKIIIAVFIVISGLMVFKALYSPSNLTSEEIDELFVRIGKLTELINNNEKIEFEDLEGLSERELSLARNYIYAKHGRGYKGWLKECFESTSWYRRDPKYNEKMIDDKETQNAVTIRNYEERRRNNLNAFDRNVYRPPHISRISKEKAESLFDKIDPLTSQLSERLISVEDLEGFSKNELRLARNYIYARHGGRFTGWLKDCFESTSWYKVDPNHKIKLSEIESGNVNTILKYERAFEDKQGFQFNEDETMGINEYVKRASTYFYSHRYNEAILDFTKAIQMNPSDSIYYHRGNTYLEKCDYDKAIADYNKALEINPEHSLSLAHRGYAYQKRGEHDRAIADYNKASEIDPENFILYHNRGGSYIDKGEYDSAILDYNRALEINPEYADAYANRGVAYYIKCDYNQAILDYTRALELLISDSAIVYFNRGGSYSKNGEYDLAISDYSKALEISPEFDEAYADRGFAYYMKGKYGKAISDCSKVLDIDSTYAMALWFKALSYDNLGIISGALLAYKSFIQYATPEYSEEIEQSKQRIKELKGQ